jgi:hypothetical protein
MANFLAMSSSALAATHDRTDVTTSLRDRADARAGSDDFADRRQFLEFPRPVQQRSHVADCQKPDGSRFSPTYNPTGTIIVATVWLVFYALATLGTEPHRLRLMNTDVFLTHQAVSILPVQEFQDRSVVFLKGD